jgi:hypothetical protein
VRRRDLRGQLSGEGVHPLGQVNAVAEPDRTKVGARRLAVADHS